MQDRMISQALTIRSFGATDHRPARWIVSCAAGSKTFSHNYEKEANGNVWEHARAMLAHLNWDGHMFISGIGRCANGEYVAVLGEKQAELGKVGCRTTSTGYELEYRGRHTSGSTRWTCRKLNGRELRQDMQTDVIWCEHGREFIDAGGGVPAEWCGTWEF